MDNSQTAVGIFDKMANVYQEKFMDVSLYHITLDTFCKLIENQNAEMLEIACGPGNITKYLLQQRPDLKILGTDLAPNMIRLAQENNPDATFQLLDCRDMKSLGKKYDAIMCGFVFPYLSPKEVGAFIHDAAEILNQNGVIYISTMEEDENNQSGIKKSSAGDEVYMYYHRADELINALKENGFEITDLQRIANSWGDVKVNDLVVIGRNNNICKIISPLNSMPRRSC